MIDHTIYYTVYTRDGTASSTEYLLVRINDMRIMRTCYSYDAAVQAYGSITSHILGDV